MRLRTIAAAGCLFVAGLAAGCQGLSKSEAQTHWKAAEKAQDFAAYVAENADKMDMEALKTEAGGAEGSLAEQFKAVTLLAALEYQNSVSGEASVAPEGTEAGGTQGQAAGSGSITAGKYQFDYPVSGPLAESFLAKVKDQVAEFWKSLAEAFYPYDCFESLLAAADGLDGATVTALAGSIPEGSGYQSKLSDAVEKWVEQNHARITSIGDELMAADYYKDWTMDDWKSAYFYSSLDEGKIRTSTADEALGYVSYLRNTLLPKLEGDFGADGFKETSELTGEPYYSTQMMVTVGELPSLNDSDGSPLPEGVTTEGKKVVAFYRNPDQAGFPGSPAPLQVMGDFMLQLPAEEYPASLSEADYYLVLTADYSYGDYYQDRSGNETKIQQVNSSTSVDLYDAKTGACMGHLGKIQELPADSIFKDPNEEVAQFPELTKADVLTYIYHNLSNPDAYVTLFDNTAGLDSELQSGESVILGSWEITYHSFKAVQTFDVGMFYYEAEEGNRFIRAEFSITNRGTEKATFLPMVYSVEEDPIVQITGAADGELYDCVDALSDDRCLNGTTLEPGESEDGELIFEVPAELAEGEGPLYAVVTRGSQRATYLLRE